MEQKSEVHEEEKQMLLKLLNECDDSYKSTVFSQLEKDFKIHKIEEIYDRKIFEKLAERVSNNLVEKIINLDVKSDSYIKRSKTFDSFEFEIRDVMKKLENEKEKNLWVMIRAEIFSAYQVFLGKHMDYVINKSTQHKE